MSGCGPCGCRPPGLAAPPPDPEREEQGRSTLGVAGAALVAVGAAMLVLGVLDAMGVLRLMGSSPAFFGLCMMLVGGFLILIARAESTGDEDAGEASPSPGESCGMPTMAVPRAAKASAPPKAAIPPAASPPPGRPESAPPPRVAGFVGPDGAWPGVRRRRR